MARINRTTSGGEFGPGDVLRLIRSGGTMTRAEIAARTGLGRSAVAQRVDALLGQNLVEESGDAPSTGGRPASILTFNRSAGLVFAVDLGAAHARVALADLSGQPLDEIASEIAITAGPDQVLTWVEQRFEELLAAQGRSGDQVVGIGMGIPGPVEFAKGQPVSPPIMPGWDSYQIPERLRHKFRVPVLVDNDVNIMALGEHLTSWPSCDQLLFIKVGTGIGCGIVAQGEIYRGAQGAAGDVGHIRLPGNDDVVCECGNTGCLEAVAGGRALVRELAALGLDVTNSHDVARIVRSHHTEAVRLLRQAGRDIGEVLAGLVNALNPEIIVIGGDLDDEQLLAGIREVVYQRSTPLATRDLRIVHSALGARVGVIGAAFLAIEHVLHPAVLDLVGNEHSIGGTRDH